MKLNFLNKFKSLKSKFVESVFLGKDLQKKIEALPIKRKVYANELMAGNSIKDIAKKYSVGKSINQTQSHITMAKNSIGSNQDIKTFSKGNGKEAVRFENRDAIEISARDWNITRGIILSLTSFQFLMEKKINEKFKNFQFLACEMDSDVIIKMFETLTTKKLEYIKHIFAGKIEEIIRIAPESFFAHVNLDFCQTLKAFREDIKIAIERNIVQVGGCIMITISARASGIDTKKELMKLIKDTGKGNYIPVYQPDECYRDTSAMYSVIVRRIK